MFRCTVAMDMWTITTNLNKQSEPDISEVHYKLSLTPAKKGFPSENSGTVAWFFYGLFGTIVWTETQF